MVTLLIITSLYLSNKNKSRVLQQHKASYSINTQKKISSVEKQQQLVEQAVNKLESTKNNQQASVDQQNKQFTANEMSMLEIQAIIPPDPDLLASLEQPFPFRNTSIPKKSPGTSSIGKRDSNAPAQIADYHPQIQKERVMEQKIKALEEKIQWIEEQHTKNTSSNSAKPSTDSISSVTAAPIELAELSRETQEAESFTEITETVSDIRPAPTPLNQVKSSNKLSLLQISSKVLPIPTTSEISMPT